MNSVDGLVGVDLFRDVSKLCSEFSSAEPLPSSVIVVAEPSSPRSDACLLLLRFNALNLLLDPFKDELLVVDPWLIWASQLSQVVLKLPPELSGAVFLRPAVVVVPIFVMSSMLSSESCKSDDGAVVAVCAIVVVAQVGVRVGTLCLPSVGWAGRCGLRRLGVSPPLGVAEGLEKAVPELVDVDVAARRWKVEFLISPL